MLRGKAALVTGGSGDIGGAIARELAAQGADVAVTYAGHREGAEAAVKDIEAADVRGVAVQLDQRDPASIEAAVVEAVGALGRLDILVNNAAWNVGIPFPDLDALTPELWDRVLETNLRGPFLLAGLNHLTRCLAVAMAPDVAVNCVAPGLVENTRMANRLPPAVSEGARRGAVLGRVGQPSDIARQVVAFCSSTSISGQVVVVDGGMPGAMR